MLPKREQRNSRVNELVYRLLQFAINIKLSRDRENLNGQQLRQRIDTGMPLIILKRRVTLGFEASLRKPSPWPVSIREGDEGALC
jgi:hypothetical protein